MNSGPELRPFIAADHNARCYESVIWHRKRPVENEHSIGEGYCPAKSFLVLRPLVEIYHPPDSTKNMAFVLRRP